jgi:hypothetical protein
MEGRATKLVILVDVQIATKSPQKDPVFSFESSSTLSSSRSHHNLPYGIIKTDLETLTYIELGSKILKWYKEKTVLEERELITLEKIKIYLYKRKPPPNINDIACTAKFKIFERGQGFAPPDSLNAVIEAQDMALPSTEDIALPLQHLEDRFSVALLKEEIKDAEKRAKALLKKYQMGENASEFEPPSKTRAKKRKLEAAPVAVDASFGAASSTGTGSGIFAMDHQSSFEEPPQFSQTGSQNLGGGGMSAGFEETVYSTTSSVAPKASKRQPKGKKARRKRKPA